MIFRVHSMSATMSDTQLGRGSHFSTWRNPLHEGEMFREKLSGSLAHVSALSIHPTSGMCWEVSGSPLEGEVMQCVGSPFTFLLFKKYLFIQFVYFGCAGSQLWHMGSYILFAICEVVKNLPANARDIRDMGCIPGLGRSLGGRHAHPLQCSCLKNPMDRGARWAAVHGVTKIRTQLSDSRQACMNF